MIVGGSGFSDKEDLISISKDTPKPQHTGVHRVFDGLRQLDAVPRVMFVICIACMGLTIVTTWPLWQSRSDPPNLPTFAFLPGVPHGILILASLVFALIRPRIGTQIHVVVLLSAMMFDQMRWQPQVVAMPLMMSACVWRPMRQVCLWFLISMWWWAGVHKVLSPYWLGPASWSLVTQMEFSNPLDWYLVFAWSVVIGEIQLAVLAWLRPRWAAPFCLALHLGIVAMLVRINWNFSVLFWNVETAIVGSWLLWSGFSRSPAQDHAWQCWPREFWLKGVALAMLLIPAGVYGGFTPHFLAHVLYSDHMPKAVISTENGPEKIETWNTLHAPVPKVRFILRQYFERSSRPGDKLHIADSRPALTDIYMLHTGDGICIDISEQEFFSPDTGGRQGVAADYSPAVFHLEKSGARLLKRSEKEMIYAVQFFPDKFQPDVLRHLAGLPNLEQIQLAGCDLRDRDLKHLSGMRMLTGIGLANTNVTNQGLTYLTALERLTQIEYEGTDITAEGIYNVLNLR